MPANNPTRIAVPITTLAWADALTAISRAGELGADVIELRLDYIKDRDLIVAAEELLTSALKASKVPLIFTCRSGKRELVPNRTGQNLSRLLGARQQPLARDYFDFDLHTDVTTTMHLYKTYLRLFNAHPQIILSYHNFENCDEEELLNNYYRMTTFSPDIIKLATKANRVEDLLTIFKLLDTARDDRKDMIAIGMGETGRTSRILGPSRGSFLSFAALEKGAESAPGQISIEELLSVYHIRSIDQDTTVYALLGDPVGHSVSPHMHNAAFLALGINAVYLPIAVKPAELALFIDKFVRPTSREMRWHFNGASVTVPHKIEVAALLDEIDGSAAQLGAINTIVVEHGKLRGYNTDVIGAAEPLTGLLDLQGAKVILIGAGGAARAVIAGLLARGAKITVYGRDAAKLSELAERFDIEIQMLGQANLDFSCDLLINTTPIGMAGWQSETTIPIPAEALKDCRIVYDLVYNPIETHLLQAARNHGAQVVSGIEMLIAQAAEQFRLWTGQSAPIEIMRAAAMKKLGK